MSQYYISPVINSNTDFDNDGWTGFNYFPVDCSVGSITITLPTNVWDGLGFYFNRTDNNALNFLTIECHTGTIQGGASLVVGGKTVIEAVFNNGDWIAPKFQYN